MGLARRLEARFHTQMDAHATLLEPPSAPGS
jgi:hypothetical protein